MRPPHGSDFLESLKDLFTEAGEDDRDPQENFIALRKPLIQYLLDASRMTAAKARASLQLSFTDGVNPETIPQLPPQYLKIDKGAAAMLRMAGSGNEFIGMLRSMIDDQQAKKTPKKGKRKRQVKAESDEESEIKKTRVSVVLKPRPSPAPSPLRSLKIKSSPSLMKGVTPPQFPLRNSKDRNSDEGGESAREKDGDAVDDSIEEEDDEEEKGQPDFAQLISDFVHQQTPPRHTVRSSESMALDNTTSPASCEYVSCPENPQDAVNAEVKTESGARASPELGDEQLGSISTKEGNTVDENPQISIETIVQEISATNSSDWETYKPKLLEALITLNLSSIPEVNQPADATQNSLNSLEKALALLKYETSRIPANTWQTYEAELVELSKSKDLRSMAFQGRLTKIARILFLPEEAEAIASKDWDRLEGVVRICTMLAQITGPNDEVLEQTVVDAWAVNKLRDIDWFKKCFGIKERVSNLTANSLLG